MFTNREILDVVTEVDKTQTELFKSQTGNAYSGVQKNPLQYNLTISPKWDETFNKVRGLLECIDAGYTCRFKIYAGNPLYDANLNTFDHYNVTFDKAVIEIGQQEYRKIKRGKGLQIRQPVTMKVYKSLQASLPDNTNIATTEVRTVTEIAAGLSVIKVVPKELLPIG